MRAFILTVSLAISSFDHATANELDWFAQVLSVTCNAESCPTAVGALFFVKKVGKSYEFHRCTAFLISESSIMSNAHCDFTADAQGYFVPQLVNGKKHYRKVMSPTLKVFTPPKSRHPEAHSGRPDVAVFPLEKAIARDQIAPLELNLDQSQTFTKLITYVVNKYRADEWNVLVLDRKECEVRRHGVFFPYSLNESPDVVSSVGCGLEAGNSGAPQFAKGSGKVEAVFMATMTKERMAFQVHEEFKREPFPYERYDVSHATNLRCLQWNGRSPKCVEVTAEDTMTRFRNQMKLLMKRTQSQYEGFEGFPLPLVGLAKDNDVAFEIFFLPRCRREKVPSVIEFILQTVRVEYGDLGIPSVRVLSENRISTPVSRQEGDRLQTEISQWPQALAPFRHPEHDVRTRNRGPFLIELPLCAR